LAVADTRVPELKTPLLQKPCGFVIVHTFFIVSEEKANR
jgi:hypothetical protein